MPDIPNPVLPIDRLRAALGDSGVLTDASATMAAAADWRGLYRGHTDAILRPAETAQVAEAVRICAEVGIAVVPQGGNTSMVGGAVPHEAGGQVVLSLARMTRIRDIDPVDMTMTVEAGTTLQAAQEAAGEAGCALPLSISSEGSAQIGGVLSTNAGGNMTLRYGNARDLALGLEVVLPDGRVWNGLRRLRKDNTGYSLRNLFIGAEGTLGIITAAVLRLVPRPDAVELAFCAVPSPGAALALYDAARRHEPAAFEYMADAGMRLVLRHCGGRLPLATPAPHYVLLELAAARRDAGVREGLEGLLEAALADGIVTDAAIAESEAQRDAMWVLRENFAEGQKREGASVKNDVSVPVSRVPDLIGRCTEAVAALIPGTRAVPFGHMGDGNIHMNFQQPEAMDGPAFLARANDIMDTVNGIVHDLDGSFSAEHGVGRLKTHMMPHWRGGTELDLMQAIKAAIDPRGMMNPGKLLP